MKTSAFSPLFFAFLAAATPLGDRVLVQRHGKAPLTRRVLLQSVPDAPAACAALAANGTSSPDLTNSTTSLFNSTLPDSNTTDVNVNSTSTDNSTDSTPVVLSARFNWKALRRVNTNRKRIAQGDLPAVAVTWQNLCLISGGDIFTAEPCVNLAGNGGLNALLADADPCDQQDIADAMIAYAKSPGVSNTDDLIANAIAYRKHPRNALNVLGVIPSTPYCQRAAKSPELDGVVNAQLDGVDPGIFGGPKISLMPFGANGTCPFGLTPDVATCTCLNGTLSDATGANSTSTDTTDAPTSTDTSDAATSTDTSTDTSSDSTATDNGTSDSTDDSTSDNTDNTDNTDNSQTNTDAPPAATDAPLPEVSAVVARPPPTSGPNFQPDDISGNVNDPNGR